MAEDLVMDGTGAPGKGADAHRRTRREPNDAARRALAEAEERRNAAQQPRPTEIAGRGGLEPVRYGDWEVKGIATDF